MNKLSFLSSISRLIPTNRKPFNNIKWYLNDKSSSIFKDTNTDFSFTAKYPPIKWSAAGFPDVLTRHMLFEGYYQPEVLSFLVQYLKKGDTYLDVGGHHGLMAVTGAVTVGNKGRVITFEPNPYARKFIQLHATLNLLENIIIEEIGLSNEIGETSFYVQKGEVTWNSTIIPEFADFENSEKIVIKLDTLDHYIKTNQLNPRAIKIDVEGAEFFILEGATETLKSVRPVISMEFNPISATAANSTVEEYAKFMKEHKYELLVLKKKLLGNYSIYNHEQFNPAYHCREDRLSNVLCVPEEKMKEFIR